MLQNLIKELKKLLGKRESIEPVTVIIPKTRDVRSRLVDPRFPREAFFTIEKAVFTHPILSQVHNLTINLANTGHIVEVIPEHKEALELIEETAYRLNVDALTNALFSQLILYGALSAEIVISPKLDTISQILRVHPGFIYFLYNEEKAEWMPYQVVGEKMVELNPWTYRYIPLLTIDGSPYGIPPMLASLSLLETTQTFTEELASLAKKMGLIGFLDVKFPPLPRSSAETEAEYQERAYKFLEEVSKQITENITRGVFLHFEGTEANFKEVGGAFTGIKDVMALLEKWTIESAKAQPALLGFSEGYTETWAAVSLHIYMSQLKNYQRIVERFLEYAYKLLLALRGIEVKDINVSFAEPPNFRAKDLEEARKIRVETVVQLYQAGLITREEALNLVKEVF